MFSSILGTVFYSVVIFIMGALIGKPLYSWVTKMLPWSKD